MKDLPMKPPPPAPKMIDVGVMVAINKAVDALPYGKHNPKAAEVAAKAKADYLAAKAKA